LPDDRYRRTQIVDDSVGRIIPTCPAPDRFRGSAASPCQDQHGATAGLLTGLNVGFCVSNNHRGRQVNSELRSGAKQHPRLWLTTLAVIVYRVWAPVNTVDPHSSTGKCIRHPVMNVLDRRVGDQPATDAGLIRHDDNWRAECSQSTQCRECARQERKLIPRANIVRTVLVQHSVAIEEDS